MKIVTAISWASLNYQKNTLANSIFVLVSAMEATFVQNFALKPVATSEDLVGTHLRLKVGNLSVKFIVKQILPFAQMIFPALIKLVSR